MKGYCGMDTSDNSRFFFLPGNGSLTYKDTMLYLEALNRSLSEGEKWRMLERAELYDIARGPAEQKAMFTRLVYWCKPSGDEQFEAVIIKTGELRLLNITSQIHMGVVFVRA